MSAGERQVCTGWARGSIKITELVIRLIFCCCINFSVNNKNSHSKMEETMQFLFFFLFKSSSTSSKYIQILWHRPSVKFFGNTSWWEVPMRMILKCFSNPRVHVTNKKEKTCLFIIYSMALSGVMKGAFWHVQNFLTVSLTDDNCSGRVWPSSSPPR